MARSLSGRESVHCFRLMLRTVKEINESFWSKQGFRTVESRFVGAGHSGSVEGFHMLEMSRQHGLTPGP